MTRCRIPACTNTLPHRHHRCRSLGTDVVVIQGDGRPWVEVRSNHNVPCVIGNGTLRRLAESILDAVEMNERGRGRGKVGR